MSLLRKRSSPVEPSNFLRAFQNFISKKRGAPFNINTQQDVPEIMQLLIDEFKGDSVVADDIISASVASTITCNTCSNFSSKEEKLDIICLPLRNSFISSFNKYLEPELLKDSNKWFCGLCESLVESIRDTKFVNCGNILIFQLKRYSHMGNKITQDDRLVKCFSDTLNLRVSADNDILVTRSFKLKATINHSGTLNAGHYWAYVREENNCWLKCNDTSVSKVQFKELSNNSSYLFIFSAE